MLPQPPDEYKGPFPPLDPRLPWLIQAHKSAEEGFIQNEATRASQRHAMAKFHNKMAGIQTIHQQRLGLQGPDGEMRAEAPIAMDFETAHSNSTRSEQSLRNHMPLRARNPYYGPEAPMGTQTEEIGAGDERHRREDVQEQAQERGGGGMRNAAQRGWEHVRMPAEFVGALTGALGVAGAYTAGGAVSAAYHGLRGAGSLIGNVLGARDEVADEEERPPPLALPPPALPPPEEPRPQGGAVPVPPYLMDMEERMQTARRHIPNLGRFASGEVDRRRRERDMVRNNTWLE